MSLRFSLIALLLVMLSAETLAQAKFAAADSHGLWWNEDKTAMIELAPAANRSVTGRIVWLKRSQKAKTKALVDDRNPDPALRKRSLIGLTILEGFRWTGERWEDGTVYDPKEGSTYSGFIEQVAQDRLKLRGFVGISLFGRTTSWSRASAIPR